MLCSLERFALRQFAVKFGGDPKYTGTRLPESCDPADFTKRVNELYDAGAVQLVDGYAPFCKHLFVPNFAGVLASTERITPENEHLLRSAYYARTDKELPVLTRFFPAGSLPKREANFLDVILYSREQIQLEDAAMGEEPSPHSNPWGIISVKAQDVPYETPMEPITSMRNALGRDQGGSGVPLDPAKYRECVEFWSQHATLKHGE